MFCSDYRDRSPPGNDISVVVYVSQPVRRSVIGIAAPHGRLIDNKIGLPPLLPSFASLTNLVFCVLFEISANAEVAIVSALLDF
jgi:hypothetical protein